MAKLIFNATHGAEDPERATLPFIAANVAATAGQPVVIFATIEAVRLATQGGSDKVAAHGMPSLKPLLEEYVGHGGQIWLCGACTKPRNITEDQLVKGAKIVGAAKLVEELVGGAQAVNIV